MFVAVDERGEDVMSDENCRRCNEKQEKKEAWRPKCAAPRLGYEQDQKQHIIALTWVTQMNSISYGKSLKVVQKVSTLFLLGSFLFVGLYLLGKEGGREKEGC